MTFNLCSRISDPSNIGLKGFFFSFYGNLLCKYMKC